MTQKTNFYKTIHETQNRCLNDLSKRTDFFLQYELYFFKESTNNHRQKQGNGQTVLSTYMNFLKDYFK